VELLHGRKHRITLEAGNFLVSHRDYTLCESEVDQVVEAFVVTNIIKLQVPVAIAHLVQALERRQCLIRHLGDFQFEFD